MVYLIIFYTIFIELRIDLNHSSSPVRIQLSVVPLVYKPFTVSIVFVSRFRWSMKPAEEFFLLDETS